MARHIRWCIKQDAATHERFKRRQLLPSSSLLTTRKAPCATRLKAYYGRLLLISNVGLLVMAVQMAAKKLSPVLMIHALTGPTWQTNSGYQSAPANEGLRRARGQYIAYLNHDDIWLPNHLQELVNALEETNSDFVYSIIERFSTGLERHVDVPDFPNATRPPEASATLHRTIRDRQNRLLEDAGRNMANPRVEYFRTRTVNGVQVHARAVFNRS